MAIRASVSLRNIEAQVTYQSLEAAVSAGHTNATAILVVYNAKNRFVEESPSVFDIDVITFRKNISDATAIADNDVLAITKPQIEDLGVSNTFIRLVQFRRAFDETPSFVDIDRKDFGKVSQENPLVAESAALDISKPLTDDLTAVGDFTRNIVYKRVPVESLAISDVYARAVSYSRQFTDTVYPTDDLDGEASLQDDQEMFFVKTRTDLASVAESLARTVSFNREFSDASTASEQHIFAVGKTLTDAAAFVDIETITFGKGLTDSAGSSEAHAFDISKTLSDTGSAEEQTALGVSKVINDAFGSTDIDTISFGKAQTDPVLTADAGSLVSQGYVDNNQYFAEIYVGTSRSF